MNEIRAISFPYCIQRVGDDRYLFLNRNHKPLGVQSSDFVEYETHPTVMNVKITPAVAQKASWNGSEDVDRIYFYNSSCIPTSGVEHMRAYLDRLAVLMALKTQAR